MLHFRRLLPAWFLTCFAAHLYAAPINVGNFVWDDLDRDGQQDAGEPGVPNVTVQLWNSTKTSLIFSDTTDANGIYLLVAPDPGSYRIRVVLPNASVSFSPKNQAGGSDTADSDINPSGTDLGFTDIYTFPSNLIAITTIDAGLISNMTIGHNIGDRVFRAAADGTQTASGVTTTVELLNSLGTVLQTTSTTTRNGASGYYSFPASPGTYRLRFIIPVNTTPTPFPNAGGDDGNDSDIDSTGQTPLFTLTAGAIRDDLDAGFVNTINVGNFVWDDIDRDGQQDIGEPGVPNVIVQLWNSSKTSLLDSETTNASGNYTLVAPGLGDYRIRVVLPNSSVSFSPKNLAGGDDTDDSDINSSGVDLGFTNIYTFASNLISISSIDAGLISDLTPGHTIGDRCFVAAADGTQTASGVPATVALLSSSGTVLQTTSATNRNGQSGYYSFAAAPGTYRLRFTTPSNRLPTPFPNAGGDDGNDSDIDADGLTPLFTLASGQVRTDLDAGFVSICNFGNFIWNDLNANGLQDSGEPGLPNVQVELWDSLKTTRIDETITNSSGNYTLVGTAPGSYRIYVIRPHPTDQFSPIDIGADDLDDSDISSTTTNFGFTNTFTVAPNVISTSVYDCGIVLGNGSRIIRPTVITQLNLNTPNLIFSGTTGGTYQLEHSTDLLSWAPIGSSLVTSFSTGPFTLPASTLDDPRHFWRVRRTL